MRTLIVVALLAAAAPAAAPTEAQTFFQEFEAGVRRGSFDDPIFRAINASLSFGSRTGFAASDFLDIAFVADASYFLSRDLGALRWLVGSASATDRGTFADVVAFGGAVRFKDPARAVVPFIEVGAGWYIVDAGLRVYSYDPDPWDGYDDVRYDSYHEVYSEAYFEARTGVEFNFEGTRFGLNVGARRAFDGEDEFYSLGASYGFEW
ncbi:MAG: hypothetical protein GF419_13435 [Ignavibacteriales bacterium]|nr:hypothetical protein [Ignavibacteriales bacterium]